MTDNTSTLLMSEIIKNVISISTPILVGLITRVVVIGFNRWMDYKAEKLSLEKGKQEKIDVILSRKIDDKDEEKINTLVKEGINFAEEVAYKSFLDPNVKQKTKEEKRLIAENYILDNVNNFLKDPDKISQLQNNVQDKIESILPTMRPELDKQFNAIKKDHIERLGLPSDSIDPNEKAVKENNE